MQCPIRCPYNGLNLTFPMGALKVEKGAIMKCPLCRPYVTVSQRVPFPVENMGFIRFFWPILFNWPASTSRDCQASDFKIVLALKCVCAFAFYFYNLHSVNVNDV